MTSTGFSHAKVLFSLSSFLDIALNELFGVFLKHPVDLVEKLVDILLNLLSLLGHPGLAAGGDPVLFSCSRNFLICP